MTQLKFWGVLETPIGKMKINIAGGNGVMGKTIKPIFESQGHEVIFSGRNSSPSLEEAARICDLTIISVPITATEEIIKRVAPHANALMDFTSLKSFPIELMLKYSKSNCEVGGLHPLFGEVKSLNGRTVVYCETKKSGKKCLEVLKAFQKAGLKIVKMKPPEHDLWLAGILQNERVNLLEAFALSLEKSGLSAKEIYEISPPPTKVLIDLVARQVDEKNDELYQALQDYNPFTPPIKQHLISMITKTNGRKNPKKIRDWFGKDFLKESQERAKKLID